MLLIPLLLAAAPEPVELYWTAPEDAPTMPRSIRPLPDRGRPRRRRDGPADGARARGRADSVNYHW